MMHVFVALVRDPKRRVGVTRLEEAKVYNNVALARYKSYAIAESVMPHSEALAGVAGIDRSAGSRPASDISPTLDASESIGFLLCHLRGTCDAFMHRNESRFFCVCVCFGLAVKRIEEILRGRSWPAFPSAETPPSYAPRGFLRGSRFMRSTFDAHPRASLCLGETMSAQPFRPSLDTFVIVSTHPLYEYNTKTNYANLPALRSMQDLCPIQKHSVFLARLAPLGQQHTSSRNHPWVTSEVDAFQLRRREQQRSKRARKSNVSWFEESVASWQPLVEARLVLFSSHYHSCTVSNVRSRSYINERTRTSIRTIPRTTATTVHGEVTRLQNRASSEGFHLAGDHVLERPVDGRAQQRRFCFGLFLFPSVVARIPLAGCCCVSGGQEKKKEDMYV